jgi:hypothetical protein
MAAHGSLAQVAGPADGRGRVGPHREEVTMDRDGGARDRVVADDPRSVSDDARLLAVDLGLRTGIAVYDGHGRLRRFGSRNFGSRTRLRGGADAVLREVGRVDVLVVEGDRALGRIWSDRAARRGATTTLEVAPERWRARLLHERERRSGPGAKAAADALARRAIELLGDRRPTSLRHDAAEAVLIGLWGCLEVGWLDALPPGLDPRSR